MRRRLSSHYTTKTAPIEKKARDDPSVSSLHAALQANRKLQEQLKRRWKEIQTRQRILQDVAVECLQYPTSINSAQLDDTDIVPCHTTPRHVISFCRTARMAQLPQQQQQQQNDGNDTDRPQGEPVVCTTSLPEDLPRPKAKQFKYQQDRKWTVEYFMDPTGSKPEPNQDTIQRQSLRLPLQLDTPPTGTILGEASSSSSSKVRKFPKAHIHHLVDLANNQQQQQQDESVDWMGIVDAMNAKFSTQRTIWECMCQYTQYMVLQEQKSKSNVTTPEQDERLFRYLALMGPQFVWDVMGAGTLAASPLMTATTTTPSSSVITAHQLWLRSNQTTALNPKLTTQPYWNADLERKLVLLMKLYYTTPQQTGMAITEAATHFPNRTRDQIVRKWERSLDPALNHTPFTPEEDDKLKAVVKQALLTTSSNAATTTTERSQSLVRMADLARTHFPSRKHHQVYQRWLEIATPEEIVAFDGWQLFSGETNKDDLVDDGTSGNLAAVLFNPEEFRIVPMKGENQS